MKLSDYFCILGSFRLKDTWVIDAALKCAKEYKERVLIDTGVSYNVDHIIGERSDTELLDVMSKFGVDHIDDFDWYLTNHLKFLKVDKLEYSLVHFYEPGWQKLVKLMLDDPRIVKVGVSNFNIEQLQEYYNEFKKWPEANEIEFSIMYHDLELVEFCKSHGIEILGYGVVGGIHACKQAIREYLLEALLRYAVMNGVHPVIRTDFVQHFLMDIEALHSFVFFNRTEITTGNYHYELTEDTKDPRALNKFRYDNPTHALRNHLRPHTYLSLDSSVRSKEVDIIPQRIPSDLIEEFLSGYEEIPRKYMMITDYLVEERYKLGEGHKIEVSDDCLVAHDQNKLISYVMLDDDNHMIKSGACHARVFRKEISL